MGDNNETSPVHLESPNPNLENIQCRGLINKLLDIVGIQKHMHKLLLGPQIQQQILDLKTKYQEGNTMNPLEEHQKQKQGQK